MKYSLMLMLVGSVVVLQAAGLEDRVRELFIEAGRVFDNPQCAQDLFEGAIGLCGNDTNRYARIIADLAHTNDAQIASQAIVHLGWFGNAEQLPFLYDCATNGVHVGSALKAILGVEGCTESSVALFEDYLSNTNTSQDVRSDFCWRMYRKAVTETAVTNRTLGANCAYRYAATANKRFMVMDGRMVFFDPGYRFSKRRLGVLRAVQDKVVSPRQSRYVNDALRELVAYPEGELPD